MRSKILLAIIVAMLILIILSIDYPELRELVVILILTIMSVAGFWVGINAFGSLVSSIGSIAKDEGGETDHYLVNTGITDITPPRSLLFKADKDDMKRLIGVQVFSLISSGLFNNEEVILFLIFVQATGWLYAGWLFCSLFNMKYNATFGMRHYGLVFVTVNKEAVDHETKYAEGSNLGQLAKVIWVAKLIVALFICIGCFVAWLIEPWIASTARSDEAPVLVAFFVFLVWFFLLLLLIVVQCCLRCLSTEGRGIIERLTGTKIVFRSEYDYLKAMKNNEKTIMVDEDFLKKSIGITHRSFLGFSFGACFCFLVPLGIAVLVKEGGQPEYHCVVQSHVECVAMTGCVIIICR